MNLLGLGVGFAGYFRLGFFLCFCKLFLISWKVNFSFDNRCWTTPFVENTSIDMALKNVKSQVCVFLKIKLFKGFTKPMKYSILLLFQALERFDEKWFHCHQEARSDGGSLWRSYLRKDKEYFGVIVKAYSFGRTYIHCYTLSKKYSH